MVVSWANRPVGVPSCPAPSAPPLRPDPPVVCPGFGFDRDADGSVRPAQEPTDPRAPQAS